MESKKIKSLLDSVSTLSAKEKSELMKKRKNDEKINFELREKQENYARNKRAKKKEKKEENFKEWEKSGFLPKNPKNHPLFPVQ